MAHGASALAKWGGPNVNHKYNGYAQKAGEAFFAAGRAATAEARQRHRRQAENYVALLHQLRAEDEAEPAEAQAYESAR